MAFDFKAMITIDDTDQFTLPVGRVIWADVFTPRTFKDEKTGVETTKYSVTLAWTKEEIVAVQAIIDAGIGRLMAQPGFPKYACLKGGKKEAQLMGQGISSDQIKSFTRGLIYDHDLDKYPYLENLITLKSNANEKSPPTVVGVGGFKDRLTSDRKEEVYRGCYGMPIVTLGFHKTTGQLYYKLKGFQKARDGEPLVGNSANINLFESFNSGETSSVSSEEI